MTVLILLVIISNAVEAIVGFGSTLLTLTLGTHFYSLEYLIAVLIPLNLILSMGIVIKDRRSIQKGALFKSILPWAGMGSLIGMSIRMNPLISGPLLRVILGSLVLMIALHGMFSQLSKSSKRSPLWLLGGGLMQGVYGAGGPLTVIYVSSVIQEKYSFRSTLSALWIVLNIIITLGLIQTNSLNAHTLTTSVLLILPLLIGWALGEWVMKKVSQNYFKKIIYLLLFFSGAALIFKT